MIELHDVSHAYESAVILRHITATLSEHRIGITGPNGSGKSTLIRMMNGLVIPTRGDVIVNGHNTRKKKCRDTPSHWLYFLRSTHTDSYAHTLRRRGILTAPPY